MMSIKPFTEIHCSWVRGPGPRAGPLWPYSENVFYPNQKSCSLLPYIFEKNLIHSYEALYLNFKMQKVYTGIACCILHLCKYIYLHNEICSNHAIKLSNSLPLGQRFGPFQKDKNGNLNQKSKLLSKLLLGLTKLNTGMGSMQVIFFYPFPPPHSLY